jgi:hypothetical protein
MKLPVNYLNDTKGNILAVQLPFAEWETIVKRLKKYEHMLNLKEDFQQAFNEVKLMQEGKLSKKTLSEFLDEL